MPPETSYPALQGLRIASFRQHPCIVIALQHHGIAGIEHGHHMWCDMARIRQHTQSPGAIAEDELHWLAGIVRNRKRMDADIAD
jgi:hypothetical protein